MTRICTVKKSKPEDHLKGEAAVEGLQLVLSKTIRIGGTKYHV